MQAETSAKETTKMDESESGSCEKSEIVHEPVSEEGLREWEAGG